MWRLFEMDPWNVLTCCIWLRADDLNVDLKGLWIEANVVAEAAFSRRIDDTQGPPVAAIAPGPAAKKRKKAVVHVTHRPKGKRNKAKSKE